MSNNFSLDISRFVEKAQGRIDLVVQKVTLDVFRSVIMMSPVGNPALWKNPESAPEGYVGGRFRGNWIADIGNYSTNILNNFDKSGNETIKKVSAIVARGKSGGVVYLVNNLPYAQRLEYGYSMQAPAGMVRTTIANYQSYINNAVSSIN